jgi:hypothetical protein
MKNNTENLKNHLMQALADSPNDFNLQEVKRLIVRAIDLVEDVEKKRNIREMSHEKRKNTFVVKKSDYFKALNAIDHELNAEKTKLEQIKNRRNLPKPIIDDDGNNDDELHNVFG